MCRFFLLDKKHKSNNKSTEIKKDLQRITKIKPFINKYNWKGINFASEKDDWKKFQKNKVTIALNAFYAKIFPAYVSKHNSNREKQLFFNYLEQRKTMALSCSKKIISIIKRNNIKE